MSALLEAIEARDVQKAYPCVYDEINRGRSAREIHLSLYPVVQRVLNPPFINPHLPKMYSICREFLPYLDHPDLLPLIRLEVTEYARRPKLEKLPRAKPLTAPVSFKHIESAISYRDWEKTAVLMVSLSRQKGHEELVRRLLLLGSGYLDNSLGHSISCTAFILLEMLQRLDLDAWPAIATLADYFCRGQFHTTPEIKKGKAKLLENEYRDQVFKATSGKGIVHLHHPITLYAIERVRRFLSQDEYDHMIYAWMTFVGDKQTSQISLDGSIQGPPKDYEAFFNLFARPETETLLKSLAGMIDSQEGRKRLGHFLIKGLCDRYQGDYNPHYMTGLGSFLWLLDRYGNDPPVVLNALHQFLDFYVTGMS